MRVLFVSGIVSPQHINVDIRFVSSESFLHLSAMALSLLLRVAPEYLQSCHCETQNQLIHRPRNRTVLRQQDRSGPKNAGGPQPLMLMLMDEEMHLPHGVPHGHEPYACPRVGAVVNRPRSTIRPVRRLLLIEVRIGSCNCWEVCIATISRCLHRTAGLAGGLAYASACSTI